MKIILAKIPASAIFLFTMVVAGLLPSNAKSSELACEEIFLTSVIRPELSELAAQSKRFSGSEYHDVQIIDGRGHVKIGFLQGRQRDFMTSFLRAIRSGAIAEIDAGIIIGPKILRLLSQIPKIHGDVTVRGKIRYNRLAETVARASQKNLNGLPSQPRNYLDYSDSDIVDFYESVEKLRIDEACQKYFGPNLSDCSGMAFEFNSSDIASIVWIPEH